MKVSVKYLKIAANIIGMALSILAVFFFLPRIISVFLPFIIAGIIAALANPIVKFAENHLRIKRRIGSAIVIVLALVMVGGTLFFLVRIFLNELSGFLDFLPELIKSIDKSVKEMNMVFKTRWHTVYGQMPVNVQDFVNSALDSISEALSFFVSDLTNGLTDIATKMASNIALTLISVFSCILASYFFIADKDFLIKVYDDFIPCGIKKLIITLKNITSLAVAAYLKAQLKIMLVIYVVLIIGFLIIGVKYAVIVAFFIALLDFLPFFGTGTVMIPWGIVLLLQKNYWGGGAILIIWAISQLIRQLIQPKLLGESVGISPIPTLIILYLGFRLKGAIGLILSVPVSIILFGLYKGGFFDNFIISVKILVTDIFNLCKFDDKELKSKGDTPDGYDR